MPEAIILINRKIGKPSVPTIVSLAGIRPAISPEVLREYQERERATKRQNPKSRSKRTRRVA